MNKRINYRVTGDVLKYFLDKHRDSLMKAENKRRQELKNNEHIHTK